MSHLSHKAKSIPLNCISMCPLQVGVTAVGQFWLKECGQRGIPVRVAFSLPV